MCPTCPKCHKLNSENVTACVVCGESLLSVRRTDLAETVVPSGEMMRIPRPGEFVVNHLGNELAIVWGTEERKINLSRASLTVQTMAANLLAQSPALEATILLGSAVVYK